MAEKISITIEANEQFAGAFQKLADQLDKTEEATGRATSAFSKFQATIITVNQGIDLMQRTLGPLWRGLGEVLQVAGKFERLDIMLKRVEGSAFGAADAKRRLLAVVNEMPLSLDHVTNAYVKLRTIGFADSERIIRAIGNAVAGFGGTTQEFQRAMIAVQQMMGRSIVSMKELRQQLGEAIPTAAQIAARELNMTLPQMFDLIAKGDRKSTR